MLPLVHVTGWTFGRNSIVMVMRQRTWPAEVGSDPGTLLENPFRTEEWTYYLGNRVVAVAYVDALPEALSAIYCYYAPSEGARFAVVPRLLSPRCRRAALPGGVREHQSVVRGEGRLDEPRAGPDANRLGRLGPYGPLGDCERVLQEAEANKGLTEIVKMPGRGHSLTIDGGWREVAQKALEFVKRFI